MGMHKWEIQTSTLAGGFTMAEAARAATEIRQAHPWLTVKADCNERENKVIAYTEIPDPVVDGVRLDIFKVMWSQTQVTAFLADLEQIPATAILDSLERERSEAKGG